MGKLAATVTILLVAGGAMGWVNRSVPESYSWSELLPFSFARPHTNLYRAAFFILIAIYLKLLARIPGTDQALAPLLKNVLPVNARRGFCVLALAILALITGWWISTNSRLPDLFACMPLNAIPPSMRREFVQIAVVIIVFGAAYLIVLIHAHHAMSRQNLALRYSDNLLIWKKRQQTLDPIPPVGHGKGKSP